MGCAGSITEKLVWIGLDVRSLVGGWCLRVCSRPEQSTSIGYWHGYANGPSLALKRRPSGQSFSSPTPSMHSMYLKIITRLLDLSSSLMDVEKLVNVCFTKEDII